MTTFEGFNPLVREADVVVLGFRDSEEAASYGSQPLPPPTKAIDLTQVRVLGAELAAINAIAELSRDDLDGFWIHLDADVLDDAIMPAVDYRMPDGLSWHELETILRTALASGRAVGMEVTIFNPRLDTHGDIARALVESVVGVLTA